MNLGAPEGLEVTLCHHNANLLYIMYGR